MEATTNYKGQVSADQSIVSLTKLLFKDSLCLQVHIKSSVLILLHSERPKLYTILAFLSAIGVIYMLKNDRSCYTAKDPNIFLA